MHCVALIVTILLKICTEELIVNSSPIGGPGHIVSIDETLVAKRKPGNPQGRPVPQPWFLEALTNKQSIKFEFAKIF